VGLLSAYLSEGNSKGVLGETKGDIGPTTRARSVHEEPPLKNSTAYPAQPTKNQNLIHILIKISTGEAPRWHLQPKTSAQISPPHRIYVAPNHEAKIGTTRNTKGVDCKNLTEYRTHSSKNGSPQPLQNTHHKHSSSWLPVGEPKS